MSDRSAPESQLRLEWVYGYNGWAPTSRSNLFYDSAGDVVYYAAGVGIVLDKCTNTQRHYLEHNDDITCLNLHPNKHVAASGEVGKSPTIYVWDTRTLETRSILKDGHTHGVSAVSFGGPSDRLLASVGSDNKNTIVVWEWKKGQALSTVTGATDRIHAIRFNPYEANVLATCGVRHMKFWTLSGNVIMGKRGIFGKAGEQRTQMCLAFGPDQITYSGSDNGSVYVWKGSKLKFVLQDLHKGPIHTIYMSVNGYATCADDGSFSLWTPSFEAIRAFPLRDTSIGYPKLALRAVVWTSERVLCGTERGEVVEVNPAQHASPVMVCQGHPAHKGELWGLACHPTALVFASASEDKTVHVWDMKTHAVVASAQLPEQARAAAFSADGGHLAVGMKKGRLVVLDAEHALASVVTVAKRKEVLHTLRYSPDNTLLAVGSNDNFVDVYNVHANYTHVCTCKGASSFITHLDFDVNSHFLQVNSGAAERLVFAVPRGSRVVDTAQREKLVWATWTCVLGDEVNGIWPKYAHTDDVNACDTAHGLVVTGDDWGKVKLFRFPCVTKGAKSREYKGHSAHVTNVRVSADASRVVSTGGGDRALLQWTLHLGGGAASVDGCESVDEDTDTDDESDDAAGVDSDLEREAAVCYERDVAKTATKAVSVSRGAVRTKAPEAKLTLQHVHGYRGYDCRDNMAFTRDGHLIYHVAAVGIVLDRATGVQRFYQQHTDDILCLAHAPQHRSTADVVATGQIGRHADIHVWDTETMTTLSVLSNGHERGVCAVSFSPDGKRLVSVGLDAEHMIVSWDWAKGTKLASARGHKDKIFATKWQPWERSGLVTVGIRHIKFWTQAGNGFTGKRGVFGSAGKSDTMLSISFGPDGGVTFTGAQNGGVYVWHGTRLTHVVANAHAGPVFVLKQVAGRFVSGGKDGHVKLWDASFAKTHRDFTISSEAVGKGGGSGVLVHNLPPVRGIAVAENGDVVVGTAKGDVVGVASDGALSVLAQGHAEGEVWALAAAPPHGADDTSPGVFVTGGDDKTVRVWDSATNALADVFRAPAPIRAVAIAPGGKLVAAGTKDGNVLLLSLPGFRSIASFHHRKGEISDMKFSPGGAKFLAVGSHDNVVDIYNISQNKRIGVCKGASSYITHVDWDLQGKLLVVNTGARETLYFEAPKGKRVPVGSTEARQLQWATETSVLGTNAMGIWPPHSDVTDVNACAKSHDGAVLATGDDFGLVKLFEYPAAGKHAKFKKYLGHSAHVTNVRWLPGDRCLVSTGGGDTAVMRWAYNNAAAHDTASLVGAAGESDDSDTDDDEEGYDSDVEREKVLDYMDLVDLIADPLRPPPAAGGGTSKPNHARPARARREGDADDDDEEENNTTHQAPNGITHRVPRVNRAVKTTRAVRRAQPVVEASGGGESGDDDAPPLHIRSAMLEHVHGYRGHDCRDNVFYTTTGHVVYHAAAAGIVLNAHTKEQYFYLEHTDDIVSMCVNPHDKYGNVVATGQIGKTADIHVWESTSLATLSIIRGLHKTAVVSLNFSSSGKLLVSVDSSPECNVAVYKWTTGHLVASARGHSRRIFLAKFRTGSNAALVTCGVKHIKFWSVTGTTLRGSRGVLGTGKMPTMLSLAFGAPRESQHPDTARDAITFSGSVSGDIYLWVGNRISKIVKAHDGPIFSMCAYISTLSKTPRHYIASAGKDGCLRFWDEALQVALQQQKLPVGTCIRAVSAANGSILLGTKGSDLYELSSASAQLTPLTHGHSLGELWALAVHPQRALFASGSDDETVCLWDLDTHVLVRRAMAPGGCRALNFSPNGTHLAMGFKTGEYCIANGSTLEVLSRGRDRRGPINVIKFSPDGRRLAVGAEEESLDFYSVDARGCVEAHSRVYHMGARGSGAVTSVDWDTESSCVLIDTIDYQHFVVSAVDGTRTAVSPTPRAGGPVWASWTSILGAEVQGIWPQDADKADINCCDLAHNGVTLATGDDWGLLKLFQFPCTEAYAAHTKHNGHSAHVANVKFTYDDRQIITAGGKDSCLFVWHTQP